MTVGAGVERPFRAIAGGAVPHGAVSINLSNGSTATTPLQATNNRPKGGGSDFLFFWG